MPDRPLSSRVPKKILLATDLSSRGDRALDRAAQLARQWSAQLLVVHALDRRTAGVADDSLHVPSWRQSPDLAPAIKNQIRRDLREEVEQLKFHIKEGPPEQVILDAAAQEQCDLIVLGTEREGALGGVFGSTVEHLVRKSPVSILVVKTRPNKPYQHVLVGTDFTEESRYGLEVACRLFPAAQLTVMHAFELPYQALLSDTALSRDFAAMERATIQEFVSQADLDEHVRPRIRTLIEHGQPAAMLRRYVEEQHADLTVIGAYERNLLFHMLIRGNTPHIVGVVPSDVLLVRANRSGDLPSLSGN